MLHFVATLTRTGPKPCGKPNKIDKGTLRLGVYVTIPSLDQSSWKWKHWGCELLGIDIAIKDDRTGVTQKVIANLKETFEEASELDGCESYIPDEAMR